MCDRIQHRGPDSSGNWFDGNAGIALGHQRLAIVDLSQEGRQPMMSESGRYVMVYNGEIYNHLEIRKQLEASGKNFWRGHSDTESLLEAIDYWGLERALKASVGMFAIAIWDRQEKMLSLARDRIGEKPLYYGWQNGVLLFGSELKALRAHWAFESVIDQNILPLYMRHGYIPAPFCVWRNVHKLLPGTWVNFRAIDRNEEPNPKTYWSFYDAALEGQKNRFIGTDQEATDLLEATLKAAVAGQMIADVPLGAFLSGGIDSSTVVALMQAQSSHRVKTFTIGFTEAQYSEAVHAKAVANFLGTDHTEMYVSADQAQAVIPQLIEVFDEPFGDSSAIPTLLVSQLARQHVTVSLSGDGGDELFGGYGRYFNTKAMTIWNTGRSIPTFVRDLITFTLRSNIPIYLNVLIHRVADFNQIPFKKSLASKCLLMADLIESSTISDYYRTITSYWSPSPVSQLTTGLPYGLSNHQQEQLKYCVEQMMAQDTITYLPDDILVKVDRAAMAFSLESRVPMLDYRLVELAWNLPYDMKVRNGQGKWLLRQVLNRYVPNNLTDRNKMGFGVPIDQWLRGPLRNWGEELLQKNRLENNFLDMGAVQQRWNEHQRGWHNWSESLWMVLMWQSWLELNTK
jgi:asparagine synthase (glutamine-hydrolysing)